MIIARKGGEDGMKGMTHCLLINMRGEGLPAGPVAGLDDHGARSALDDRSTDTDIIDMADNKKNIPTSSISHTSRQSVVSSPKELILVSDLKTCH